MPLRSFTEFEKGNLAKLTSLSIDATIIQPTRTGLGKAILDATAPVRNFLRRNGLHDYETQGTGARENGAELTATFVSLGSQVNSRTSLYRPKAKGNGGDPRIWFSGLPEFSNPDDLIALVASHGGLICINITQENLIRTFDEQIQGPLLECLNNLSGVASQISDELLARLRALAASGPLPSVMQDRADTAIGRTLETALGIEINSRKEPDYNGIELSEGLQQNRARTVKHSLQRSRTGQKANSKAAAKSLKISDINAKKTLNCTVL